MTPRNPLVCIIEGKCEACGGSIDVAMAPLPKRHHIEVDCRMPGDCVLRAHLAMLGRRLVDGRLVADE